MYQTKMAVFLAMACQMKNQHKFQWTQNVWLCICLCTLVCAMCNVHVYKEVCRWSFYKRISSACVHRLSDSYLICLQIEAISELCGKQVANSFSFALNSCIRERERACVFVPSIFIFGWKSGPEIAASCNDQCDNNNFIDKDVIVLVLLDRKFTSPSLFTHAFSCVSFGNNNNYDNGNSRRKNQPIPSTISQSKIISKKSECVVCYSIILYHFSLTLSLTHFLHSHFWYLSFFPFLSFVPILLNRLLYCKLIFAQCEMWVCVCGTMLSLCSLLHVIPE